MTKHNKQQELLQLAEPVVVVGLGKTGLSVARFLARHDIDVTVVDSRDIPPGLQELRGLISEKNIITGGFNADVFKTAATLIVSPGISIQQPLIKEAAERGAAVIGDIELFARVANASVVAITGSNGKSTVTTLVAEMAVEAGRQVKVGGNLGEPALDLLDDNVELYVLELSSFQLETTYSLDPAVSVVLNISEDHMDRYDSLQDYMNAKARIFNGRGVVIANLDDHSVMQMVDELGSQRGRISFGSNLPFENNYGVCHQAEESWLCKGQELLMSVNRLGIKGSHNIANALAALALGDAMNLPMDAMLRSLQSYTGLPHRMQWVAECHGINWFNDSKATNVGAAVAAIEGAPGEKIILIAGGQGKGQDFGPLQIALGQRVRLVVLMGEDAELLYKAIGSVVATQRAGSMKEAVSMALSAAKTGDSVLLSPACASFDMFKNYEDRGEVYMACVREACA